MKKVFECPTCPYCKYGNCSMYPENNPILECDAYYNNYFEDEEIGFDPYLGCYTDDC